MFFPANQNLYDHPIQIQINFNDVPDTDPMYDPTNVYNVTQVSTNSEIKFVRFLGVLIDPKLCFKFYVEMLDKKISTVNLYFSSAE